MRKSAPLLFALLLIFSLPAQERVVSNSIGQDRGSFVEQSEYALILDEEGSTLYHKDEPVWRETRTLVGNILEVQTYHFDCDSLSIKRYENNRLIAEGEGDRMWYFAYDQSGIMLKSTLLIAGELEVMEFYSYDVGTKSLNSIRSITSDGIQTVSYFGDPVGASWFSYAEGDLFAKVTQLSQNLQIQELWRGDTLIKSVDVEIPPEGGIRLITKTLQGEVSELYDSAGLLKTRITPSLTSEYQYNEERTLIEERQMAPPQTERIIRYEGGRTVSESLYQGGLLEIETLYPLESGKVETLYDKGVPYCDIQYALDGRRVLSIGYR